MHALPVVYSSRTVWDSYYIWFKIVIWTCSWDIFFKFCNPNLFITIYINMYYYKKSSYIEEEIKAHVHHVDWI